MKKSSLFFLLLVSLYSLSQIPKIDTLKEVKVTIHEDYSHTYEKDIFKNEIKKFNHSVDPPVLLKYFIPNITMYSDGGNNNGYMYFRIRGIDQTRLNATLDEMPLNEPEDQGFYFSNYTDFLSNINSITVTRGVSVGNPTVSSFAGSFNFESLSLIDSTNSLDLTYGSFNTKRISFSLNSRQKNGFRFYSRFSKLNSDGYRDHSGTDAMTYYTEGVYEKGKNLFKWISFLGTSKNEMAYLASAEDDIKINRKNNTLLSNEKDDFLQNFNSLQYTYKINNKFTFKTSTYYNFLKGGYGIFQSPDLYNYQVQSHFLGSISSISYKNYALHLLLGTHINFYDRQHTSFIEPNSYDLLYKNIGHKNEQLVFFKGFFQSERFSFQSEFQLRNVTFNYNKSLPYNLSINNIDWLFFNYRFCVNYKLLASTDRNKLSFFIGQTHREPTRNDMFAGFDDLDSSNYSLIGNFHTVKPETVLDIEGAFIHSSVINDFSINLYSMQFRDEIAAIGQLSYIGLPLRKNVDKSYRMGMEFDDKYRFRFIRIKANFAFNLANITTYKSDYANKVYNNITPLLTPKFISNIGSDFYLKKIIIGLQARYISKSYLDNENTSTLPDLFEVNLSTHTFLSKRIQLVLGANNVLNKDNYNAGYVMDNKRYFYVAPTINFYTNMIYTF